MGNVMCSSGINAVKNPLFLSNIKNTYDLCETALRFPRCANLLMQRILASDNEFRRLIRFSVDLKKIAKQFPQYSDDLIQRVLSSEVDFRRLITCNVDLCETAKQFPAHADALIQKVLNNPKYFDSLIKNDHGLNAIKEFCPKEAAIQSATSFQEARMTIQAEKKIEADQVKLRSIFRQQPQFKSKAGLADDLSWYQSGSKPDQLTSLSSAMY